MKRFILVLVLFVNHLIIAQTKDIQNTIEKFFVAFHTKDSLKMKSVCVDNIILQSIEENIKGVKLSDETAADFYKSIVSIPANLNFEEKILSYNIQVDGTMAHAWTPYEFYINGKLNHRGVNAFTLFKENDNVWKIIHLIDTRRK